MRCVFNPSGDGIPGLGKGSLVPTPCRPSVKTMVSRFSLSRYYAKHGGTFKKGFSLSFLFFSPAGCLRRGGEGSYAREGAVWGCGRREGLVRPSLQAFRIWDSTEAR